MRLVETRVENFKCIEDSDMFRTDQVTCLVGKNEAGKTALLEAMYKLNPVESDKSDFKRLEYPRRHLASRQAGEIESQNVLTTVWELADSDVAVLENAYGSGVVVSKKVVIRKGYDNVSYWTISLNERQSVRNFLDAHKLDAAERSHFQKVKTVRDLRRRLAAIDKPTSKHQALRKDLQERVGDMSLMKSAAILLTPRLPKFLYFDTYHQLPGRVSVNALRYRRQQNEEAFGDRIFLALLNMAGTDLDRVDRIERIEELTVELEAIQNSLTSQIFDYWSQNDHLEVDFEFRQGRKGDRPPFNEGYVFETRIENRRHRASVNFDERSTGFIWFFSFLVWFSQVKRNYGDRVIILLDEPGLTLHGKAQQDLLRYINEQLRPSYQVMYTAHSPFMIDIENIFSLRTVEDKVEVVREDGKQREEILGTKVSDQVLRTSHDTLFPLQGILGFDVAHTLFVGPYVLVVEGASEFSLLHWFSKELAMKGREPLDLRWAICPADGADKVTSFVTLFRGRGLRIATLVDYHDGQKGKIDRLEESGLLEPGHLFRTTDYVDQEEADIEDLLGRRLYIQLVNEAMHLPEPHQIPTTRPDDAPERIAKEADEHCALLPPHYPNFSHYMPVEYLLSLPRERAHELDGLDEALDRFEEFFCSVNDLI